MKEMIQVETYNQGFTKSIEVAELTILQLEKEIHDWHEFKMLFLNEELAKKQAGYYKQKGYLTKILIKTLWIE